MKKRVQLYCHECDLGYAVSYDTDKAPNPPEICPFCSELIVDEEESVDDDWDDSDEDSE